MAYGTKARGGGWRQTLVGLAIFMGTVTLGWTSNHDGRASAAASSVYGLPAMAQMERLPLLQPHIQAAGQSSYQRNTSGTTSGNADFNNFLYTIGSGSTAEKVMLDEKGPGTVYRIWMTGFDPVNQWLKVYFDGETTPRIHKPLRDVFSGTSAPFISPLVADNTKSSGGYTTYLPLPYAKSVRITTNMSGYYNVGYHSYSPDTPVATWTGNEDSSAVRNSWNNLGADPKPDSGNTTASGTADVAANGSRTILDTAGPRVISSIKLKVPGITPLVNLFDNGRAHKGSSQFRIAVDPANTGVTLKRRLDYGIANQKAGVYVDGTYAGDWYDAGSDSFYHWRDSSFAIPASLTAGKSSLTIKVQFISSAVDWNEFHYWAYSKINGTEVLTDTLDVSDITSENQHAYTITSQVWSGNQSYTYPPPAVGNDGTDILNNTRLRIGWDNEAVPSIDAPLGAFFGVGNHGAYPIRSLMAGMAADGQMYVYLPMPFQQRAVVQLINNRTTALNDVHYEVKHKPYIGDFAQTGYLRAKYTATTPAQSGRDISLLDVTGSGNLVGITASYADPSGPAYLEGDERIYVDDSQSPSMYGTGTEDFFDGGWYFERGPFSRPAASLAMNGWMGTDHRTVANRFFLADSIPFKRRITASIQHGGFNETTNTKVWSLAYYYQKPAVKLNLTDTVDVGNSSSQSSHRYTISGQTFSGSRTYQYEGIADNVNITDNGRAHRGASQFDIAITAANNGIVLRRRFDQGILNQQADVYVDNVKAGTWYVAGGNGSHRWRDSDFLIPPSFTADKSKVRIKIQYVASSQDWNEFRYQAWSIMP